MQRLMAALAIAASALGGCTTTHHVRRPDTVEQIEPLYTKARSRMTLLHERPPGATSTVPPPVAPAPSATSDGAAPLVDLSNLRGYTIKRRGKAALEGLGVGILVGVVAGVATGFAAGDDPKCMNMNSEGFCLFEFSAADKAAGLGIVGALIGGLLGTVIGSAIGHTDEYIFRNPYAQP